MANKSILKLIISGTVLAICSMVYGADQGNDVFVDEGDGDFETMPLPVAERGEVLPIKKSNIETTSSRKLEVIKAKQNKQKTVVKQKDVVGAMASVKNRKTQPGGIYVTTNTECPMTRTPASEGEEMIVVKPAKKIWVQKVKGGKWFRAFNKSGEPGYIQSSCVTAP